MRSRARVWASVGAAVAVVAMMCAAPASAASEGYRLPVWFNWDKTVIDVVIVPPEHGQIYNANGVFGGEGADELTPNNSYMKAILHSIDDWKVAIEEFGSDRLKEELVINVSVLGQGSTTIGGAEILVVTDQTKGPVLGVAVSTLPCIVNNSKMFVSSFTYADMYNTNGQEFGHCLGLDHVVDDQPQLDVMNGHYPHNIGAKDTPLHPMSNLDVKALEYVFFGGSDVAIIPPVNYLTIDIDPVV
jgi:hypothetical protein